MEEIKVGEYVRTEEGNIGKLIAIRVEDKEYLEGYIYNIHIHKNLYMNLKNKDIIKHSPNLIDLIEERRLCKWFICAWNNRLWFRSIYVWRYKRNIRER